jgi:hypothetical protein
VMRFLIVALALVAAFPASARTPKLIDYAPTIRCVPFVGNKNAATAVQQQRADALIAAFEAAYPPALGDPARVEIATVLPATLKAIVAELACLSTHPGADPFVPEQAAALFASKRYGKTAFALLAQSGNARFARQMRSYIAVRR